LILKDGGGRKRTREYFCFSYFYEEIIGRFVSMDKERLICISVRLTEAEYKAIQSMAKQDFTTMSGILRKLLRDAVERGENDGN